MKKKNAIKLTIGLMNSVFMPVELNNCFQYLTDYLRGLYICMHLLFPEVKRSAVIINKWSACTKKFR